MKKIVYIGISRLHRNRANLIQTLQSVDAFNEVGVDITLYLPAWSRRLELRELLKQMGVSEALDVRPSHLLRSGWSGWGLPLFCRIHRRSLMQADQVYCRSALISLHLGRAGIGHVFEVHNLDRLMAKQFFPEFAGFYRSGIIRQLITVTHADKADCVAKGLPPERIFVHPNAVSLRKFRNIAPIMPSRLANDPLAVYVGRISYSRGLEIFVELVRRGLCRMQLVGDTEDEIPDLAGLTAEPFVPHARVPEKYAMADLVLLPYQRNLEHVNSISPLKMFEAMASGRPVIVSDLPTIRELVVDGETALLVPADDVEAWCSAVTRLRNDPELALRLAAAAQNAVASYDWTQRARNLMAGFGWSQSATAVKSSS